jgi:hypothetical protein
MANYKAVANGNWSALATWQDDSTGSFIASTVLPGASDVVYFNNFTVQMDVDATVSQIRNNSTTGVTAGGSGVISASRTVNADLFRASAVLITISAVSPSVVNMNGNIPGTVANSFSNCVNMTGDSTLNFVGNVVGSLVNGVQSVSAINVSTGGTLNLTGDVTGGNNTATFTMSTVGIRAGLNSIINIVGNLNSGIGTTGNAALSSNVQCTINVTGNVTGSAGNGSSDVHSNAGVFLANSLISCTIVGNVTANNGGYGVYSPLLSGVSIIGNLTNSSNGTMAFAGSKLFLTTPTEWQFIKPDLTTITLYTPGVATGHPATNNVRTGIVYGPTNNLTGTCAVPPANTVSLGVPVDNTVGTASLDANALAIALDAALTASLTPALTTSLDASLSASLPAAIAPLLWDEAVTNITTPNSIGERLKNCSTVATTGAQIASFNP